MTQDKTFAENSSLGLKTALAITGAAMVLVSIYLTQHYFQVKFPSNITEGSMCDINSFFNCDAATHSHASNILGVPISVFGMMIGFFTLLGTFLTDRRVEGTLFTLLGINLLGCIALFFYSLFALGTLCPFCSVYYILSAIAFALFYRYGSVRTPHLVPLVVSGVLTIAVSAAFYSNVQGKTNKNSALANDLIQQYDNLPKLGNPSIPSPFWLARASERFEDAPLQIVIFSDYQCPACRMLSDISHDMAKRYRGKINIQYVFYPLDHNCNDDIQRPMNPLSCQGAYLTACVPDKFDKVHDDIFANQDRLTMDWIRDYARRENVTECLESEEIKQKVREVIAISKPFNINSTPSMLVNGVKIVGVLPPDQLYIIFDEILSRSGN
jgi:protein-disulfide isomerase